MITSHPIIASLASRRSISSLTALAALTVAVTCPPLSAQSIPAGDLHTGTLRIERPNYTGQLPSQIIIRANLPVPDLLFEPVVGENFPLAILNPDGTYAPTQVESVTRYSGSAPHSSIVEVIAEVDTWSSWTSGIKEYKVVQTDNNGDDYARPTETQIHKILREKTPPGSTLNTILRDQESIIILTEDALGNKYIAYPLLDTVGGTGSLPNETYVVGTERFGELQTTATSFSQQIPYPSHASNTYPHLFGVHAVFDVQSGSDALGMALIISNGASDYSGTTETLDDGLGYAIFKSIKLLLRQPAMGQPNLVAQQLLEDPFESLNGTPVSMTINGRGYDAYDLVEAFPSEEGNHMLDALGQFHRRLVISAEDTQEVDYEEAASIQLRFGGQAFATKGQDLLGNELWSWFNPDTAQYFPQKDEIPTLDYSASTPHSSYSGLNDLRATLTDWRVHLEETVGGVASPSGAQGPIEFDPSVSIPVGWANPLGKKDINTGSGAGIAFLAGGRHLAAASLDGVLYEAMKFRLRADRHPNFAFMPNGRAENESEHLIATVNAGAGFTHYIGREFTFSSNRSSNDFYPSGSIGNTYVAISGTTYQPPTQYSAYTGVSVHADWDLHTTSAMKYADHSHITRFLLPAMALAYGANDPISKAYIAFYADLAPLAMPTKPISDSPSNWAYARNDSVFSLLKHSAGHEQVGSPEIAARPLGWTLQFTSAAYEMGNSALRTRVGDWIETAASVLIEEQIVGQDENGVDVASFGAKHSTKYYQQFCTDPVVLNPGSGDPAAPLVDAPTSRQNWEAMVLANGLTSVLYAYAAPGSTLSGDLLQALEWEYNFFGSPVLWNSSKNSFYVVSPISSTDDVLDTNGHSNVFYGHPVNEGWPTSVHLASTDANWMFFSEVADLASTQLECSSGDKAYYPGDPTKGGHLGQPPALTRTVDHYYLHAFAQAKVFATVTNYDTRALSGIFNNDYNADASFSSWTLKQLLEGIVDPTDANIVGASRWSNCFSFLAKL